MLYKFLNENRDYSLFRIYEVKDLVEIQMELNPISAKLFNNDLFEFDNQTCIINKSSIRENQFISGLLLLEGNKTYGKFNKRSLYKCIPDDCRLPIFLIPYEVKKIGFSKNISNIYITFEFHEWTQKHPIGKITQNLGSVDDLKNFYEYQLYCKSLHHSMQLLNRDTLKSIELKKQTTNDLIDDITLQYKISDKRLIENGWNIFTIDPTNCLDFDDAFSISQKNDEFLVSIYISNVSVWLDYLELWNSLSKRISTIYLPDKKRPMLPTILSDNLCSLGQNQKRIAFCLDLKIKDNEIISLDFSNVVVEVSKNFRYEEKALLENSNYLLLKNIVFNLYKTKTYTFLKRVSDSHDLVGNLMLMINFYSAKNLLQFKNGIFRTTQLTSSQMNLPTTCPEELSSFLLFWHNNTGSYQMMNETTDNQDFNHRLLDLDYYVHISSPIRRIVDLLNMIQFVKNNNSIQLSSNAYTFYQSWIENIEYINISTRSIRKLQSDCQLLHFVENSIGSLEKEYKGFCLDKLNRSDGLFQYVIYLPELKITSRMITTDELDNFQENKYLLYVFKNEHTFKKKIRIQLIK